MERGCSDLSVADTNDLGVCSDKSYVVAPRVDRTGGAKFENCACHRPSRNWCISYRATLWPYRCSGGLFDGDDPVVGSTYCMVHTWHLDLLGGYFEDIEPTFNFSLGGHSLVPWGSSILRSILFSSPETVIWGRYTCCLIPMDASVRNGTKAILLGSASKSEEQLFS